MFLAMGLVLVIFILPALAISWVVPAEDLTLTAGLMQAFEAFFAYFECWLAHADHRPHDPLRLAGRHADLAGRAVQGPAADRAPRGLHSAVLPEDELARHPAEHPGRPGLRDDAHRPAVRLHPGRLQRLLDLLGDDDAGLPGHVRADVHRRYSAATAPAGAGTRLHGAGADSALHRRASSLRSRRSSSDSCRRPSSRAATRPPTSPSSAAACS